MKAAQTYVPDRSAAVHRLRGATTTLDDNDVDDDNSALSALHRADTMRDTHENLLYSDVAADGTIQDDDENGEIVACDIIGRNRHSRCDEAVDRRLAATSDDDILAERANNVIYDFADRVTTSKSADSLLSDVNMQRLRRQQKQQASIVGDLPTTTAVAATSPPPAAAERKALPRMGAKTLKLKSPSTSCISRGAALSVVSNAGSVVEVDASLIKNAVASSSSNDSLLSPVSLLSPASISGAEEKMKESLTDSGCSIDATPTSPTEIHLKNGKLLILNIDRDGRQIGQDWVWFETEKKENTLGSRQLI